MYSYIRVCGVQMKAYFYINVSAVQMKAYSCIIYVCVVQMKTYLCSCRYVYVRTNESAYSYICMCRTHESVLQHKYMYVSYTRKRTSAHTDMCRTDKSVPYIHVHVPCKDKHIACMHIAVLMKAHSSYMYVSYI